MEAHMTALRIASVAAPFGRDLDEDFGRIATLLEQARGRGVNLLVLPEAALGGYLAVLDGSLGDRLELPPALRVDGPEIRLLAALAGDMVVCAGFAEDGGDGRRYNAAVCVSGDGVLGTYRKVHQPLSEGLAYSSGHEFPVFDTPVGRLGMLICYDKAFPEAARAMALDGAEIIACLSAWPTSRTDAAPQLADDRWTRKYQLFDRARALDNQVVWVASNQSGTFGSLRFVCHAEIVDPSGEVLASTGPTPGMAVAEVDVAALLGRARQGMFHLRDCRPELYSAVVERRVRQVAHAS
jgi:predicted amidohydrolase